MRMFKYGKFIRKIKTVILSIMFFIGILFILASILGPYLWMVSGSFKSSREMWMADCTIPGQEPTWIPRNFTFGNYYNVNQIEDDDERSPMLEYFQNSLWISSGTMIFTVLISMFAAYGISRINFGFKKSYELSLYVTQMFPGVAFLIPVFVIFIYIQRTFNLVLVDTYLGLILTYTTFALPFSILMLKNYFDTIPFEIDEQARIDGCARWQVVIRIIFPLAKPGIISVAIFAFILGWSELLFATLLTRSNTKTVSLGLMDYVANQTAASAGMMADCVLISLPILVFFTFLQKYILSGLIQGATKG